MCGICGKLRISDRARIEHAEIANMCNTLARRGPDDEGIFLNTSKVAALGHRRLSIIDIEGSKQPLSNEDMTVWIAFNGEIYNFQELRADLLKKGHQFKTQGDTEVIVHLYEEYGQQCVEKLRGMFAFAIWDENRQEMFLARDRVGIKPLHYYIDNNVFIFGSEIKAILADSYLDARKRIDIEAFHYYFCSLYVPAPLTMFEGIRKLLPGHWMRINANGKLDIQKYWDVHFKSDLEGYSEQDCCQRLKELITEAVKIRLISDVPLGAFLSGGMDSSTVVAIMSQINQSPIKTFSIGFSSEKYNEAGDARTVARHCGTDHTEVILEPHDIISEIRTLIEYFDEPFADSSLLPTYLVSKVARQNVTVALSGDGGDELFGGYHWWQNRPRYQLQLTGLPGVLKSLITRLAPAIPDGIKGKHFLSKINMPYERYLLETKAVYDMGWRGFIYSQNIQDRLAGVDPYRYNIPYLRKDADQEWSNRIMEYDLKTYIPNDILTKVDRMSMFCSLEARVPLLDHKLIEFAARIPSHIIFKNSIPKYILKKTMEDALPADILYKKKQGFSIPLEEWLRSELKEQMFETVFSPEMKQFFDMGHLRQMVNEFVGGDDSHKHRIWVLFTFAVWLARHF